MWRLGPRLWALSRASFPKQFLCLTGYESLFQKAARRLSGLVVTHIAVSPPFFVSNEEHRFLASEQLREISIEPGTLLLELVSRNTAPAVTSAALAALEHGGAIRSWSSCQQTRQWPTSLLSLRQCKLPSAQRRAVSRLSAALTTIVRKLITATSTLGWAVMPSCQSWERDSFRSHRLLPSNALSKS